MYIVNYGEITTNKPITEEVKEVIESIIGEEDICDVGEDIIEISEIYDHDFDITISNVIDEIKPFGYVLNGSVEYSGNYEGTIYIENNEVKSLCTEEAAVKEADDEELIKTLKSRGYNVTKEPNLTKLFYNFLSLLEDREESFGIFEDLQAAEATNEELEYLGYEMFLEEEE